MARVDAKDILARLDFRTFYQGELPGLRGNGDEMNADCPFHDDQGQHFYANAKTGAFFCHGCDAKGDPFSFLMQRHDVDFPAAVADLAKRVGLGNGNGNGAKPKKPKAKPIPENITTAYHYHDEQAQYVFSTVRFEEAGAEKTFRQWRYDFGTESYVQNIEGVRLVPYQLAEVLTASEVIIAEGEKDVDNLRALGLVATCNPMGAGKWRPEFSEHFKGKAVVILPDNDLVGQDHGQKVAQALFPVAASVKVLDLPGLPEKGDVSDWLAAGGTVEQLRAMAGQAAPWKPKGNTKDPCSGIISAADLMGMKLPEVRWCVPDLLPEGLCVLAGNPKLGKSWLALALVLAVGSGGRAFGKFDVPRGKALYLALEDSKRRIQSRVRQIVDIDPGLGSGLANVSMHIEWPTMDEGGLEHLDRYAEANPDLRLIVVDTLVKLRPKTRPKGLNAYEVDSIHLAEIKALADRRNLCVLVVTHMNKTKGHDDPFSAITGSQGQFGAADTALLLVRGRGRSDAELKATGRDIISQDYAMSWEAPLWIIKGNAEDVAKTNERQAILDVLKEAEDPMRPKEIAEAIGKRADAVRFLVGKLKKEGLVREAGYGKYLINTTHTTHTTHSASSAHSAHTRTWLDDLDDRQV